MKSVLITGGTGSFGRKFCEEMLTKAEVERLVVFSRDELKQYEMFEEFKDNEALSGYIKEDKLRFFLGDIRDRDRLSTALTGVDTVVHAAALKQVPAAEYNPFEFVKTNVLGAQNVIDACYAAGVKTVVALSTDKAAAPINVYGATKLCSDRLFTSANNYKGTQEIKFLVVRYGNVMGSRGSVIPLFTKQKSRGKITITDERMTRFNISLEQGIEMVLECQKISIGGEIFVPKIPSYRICDLAQAIAPDCETEIIGLRPGEKLHEEMITTSDANDTIDIGKYFVITPPANKKVKEYYFDKFNATKVPEGFSYNSGQNSEFLSVENLKELIARS